MSSAVRRWVPFTVGALSVLAALGWVTSELLALEERQALATAENAHGQRLRLALWRMDSWLAPRLAPEASRPYFEYQPFYGGTAPELNWTTNPSPTTSTFIQSPLLNFQSEIHRLHFQLDADGSIASPQVPQDGYRSLALSNDLPPDFIHSNGLVLDDVRERVRYDELLARVEEVESTMEVAQREVVTAPSPVALTVTTPSAQQVAYGGSNRAAHKKRADITQTAKLAVVNCAPQLPGQAEIKVGPLVPVWLGDDSPPELYFVRRVVAGEERALQGFLVDWEVIHDRLLGEIEDLFPEAELQPVSETRAADDESGRVLATVPVELQVDPPSVVDLGVTPARSAIGLTWLAAFAAIGIAGVSLHRSHQLAETRSRFASAVTHELRTPLTTFRMYSEMLASGMVTDEERRREYATTLFDESNRLAALVENVLAYSRLERGRAGLETERTTLGATLDRLLPLLERRADEAELELVVDRRTADDQPVQLDVDAVGQILFNLVDNAAKYGRSTETPRIDLTFWCEPGRFLARVADHGPGVPEAVRREIFTPFERGRRGQDDPVPGIGLGLALSRGLARDLGGELTLEPTSRGASFRLSLPA